MELKPINIKELTEDLINNNELYYRYGKGNLERLYNRHLVSAVALHEFEVYELASEPIKEVEFHIFDGDPHSKELRAYLLNIEKNKASAKLDEEYAKGISGASEQALGIKLISE